MVQHRKWAAGGKLELRDELSYNQNSRLRQKQNTQHWANHITVSLLSIPHFSMRSFFPPVCFIYLHIKCEWFTLRIAIDNEACSVTVLKVQKQSDDFLLLLDNVKTTLLWCFCYNHPNLKTTTHACRSSFNGQKSLWIFKTSFLHNTRKNTDLLISLLVTCLSNVFK